MLATIALVLPFAGSTTYCSYQVAAGNGAEQFRLGFVDIPKYLGAGASYLDVLILNIAVLIALGIGLGARYYHYRHERDFMRKYRIKGETGFFLDFKDPDGSGAGYGDYDL